jgi:hypothetical protein
VRKKEKDSEIEKNCKGEKEKIMVRNDRMDDGWRLDN